MRAMKFRAWDGKAKRMVEPKTVINPNKIPVLPTDRGFELDTSYILMQYTGLKDKNGVEIYEGDIISTWYDQNDLVEWGVGGWLPFINTIEWPTYWEENQPRVEVVGNIWKNPELLE